MRSPIAPICFWILFIRLRPKERTTEPGRRINFGYDYRGIADEVVDFLIFPSLARRPLAKDFGAVSTKAAYFTLCDAVERSGSKRDTVKDRAVRNGDTTAELLAREMQSILASS